MSNHTIAVDRDFAFFATILVLFAMLFSGIVGYQTACSDLRYEHERQMQEKLERDRAREHERVRDEEHRVCARLGIDY